MSEAVTKELPENWEWSTLGDVCEKPQYGWTTKASQEGDLHLLRTTDITSGQINWDTVPYCVEEPEDKEKYLIKDGDIVVSRAGSVGVSYLISNPEPSVFASYLIRFKPLIDRKYVYYFLKSPAYWNAISEKSAGIALQNVNASKLKEINIPVAPLEQQKRIVAKIEELFSHIDAGIEALKKAKQLLKQYRQSVLKAAVTGELTKEWRREANKGDAQGSANVAGGRTPGATKLEPANQLLQRILETRRQLWEQQQLEQFKAKGKMPKNDKWKEKYKEPDLPKAETIEAIPDEWAYCGIEMLLPPDKAAMKTGPFGSLLKKHEHKNEGVPVLGIENIASMQFVPGSKIHITEQKAKELDGYKVEEGDILISRSGTVGEVCVVPDIGEARISTNLMKLSLVKGGLDPVYFTYLFNGSPFVLGQVSELCKGSTRDFLNQDILKKLLFVLPPHQEQLEIIEKVEERFYKIERLDKEVDIQVLKAEKNKQSVLASAFSGGLN